MSDLMLDFKHLEAWDDNKLFNRQQELKNSAPDKEKSDDTLQELLAIARVLRRRTTAPKAKTGTKAPAPSLDML